MRVVFNGKPVGYAYVQYIVHSEGQQTETILASLFDDQDQTIWSGVKKMVFSLDKNFLTVEGFDSKDNFVCTQIIPTRMILQCHATKAKPLDKNALTPEAMESVK
ncbi:MAG: hypothetical protein M3044_18195 [Thermoproteota archaeon]|nr:hypothetical protein [Thermoproteota archaeon]